MSENRSIEEIEASLRRTREDLSATIDQLVERLAPKALAEDAKAKVKSTAKTTVVDIKRSATSLVSDAKKGDPKAISILAGVSLAVVGYVALKFARRG